mmetsp:Transcript_11834/g.13915  ORF Transcript_11834/g.13915 Transcript_11834/m.13915 type:complete len:182 (+) Transcript_11834:74-619(+)
MVKVSFIKFCGIFFLLTNAVTAVFGVPGEIPENPLPDAPVEDAELDEAIQMFASMSPEEMQETILEMTELLGDDPESIESLNEIMLEISKMDATDAANRLAELVQEEDIALAMGDTMEFLQTANEGTWEQVLSKKDHILQSLITNESLSQEDIDLYKGNPKAWEDELKAIWGELQKEAAEL